MAVSQQKLGMFLLWSVILGVFFGLLYDVFRIARLAFRLPYGKGRLRTFAGFIDASIVFAEDILFSLICSAVTCVFIFSVNSGRFRSIVPIGLLAGFFAYYKTVGRAVMFCSERIISFIKFLIKKIVSLTVVPVARAAAYLFGISFGRLFSEIYTFSVKSDCLRKAENGFYITRIKGKRKNEEAFKYFRKSGGGRVHSVLHGDDNKNAV